MKIPSCKRAVEAFALVELLLVVAVLLLMAWLWMPAFLSRPTRSLDIACMKNLGQVGLALGMFASDNSDQFPPQLSVTNGGSLELIGYNSPALHFQTLSNYLVRNWRVWHCPADRSKQSLTTNSPLSDRNLSYFLGVDVRVGMTNAIHAGDRNLQVAGQAVRPGLFMLTTNTAIGWTGVMHGRKTASYRGNLLFGDGHVRSSLTGQLLVTAIQRQGLATNRLAVP